MAEKAMPILVVLLEIALMAAPFVAALIGVWGGDDRWIATGVILILPAFVSAAMVVGILEERRGF